MEKQQRSGQLVLVMLPFQGHITPLLQLATILHSKGFSITIIHPELNSPDPSNNPEFNFVSIPDKLTEAQLSDKNLGSVALSLNENCEAQLHRCIKEMVDSTRGDRVLAILYDSIMYCAQDIADDLGIPGITLRTGSATTLLMFPVVPDDDKKDIISETESPELQALQLQHFIDLISQKNPSKTTMDVRAALTKAVKNSSAIIVNSMEFLERAALSKVQDYFPAPVFTIGPLHKLAPTISSSIMTEDDECLSWLNKQAPKSVIYVSFGSMANIDEQELIEIGWGLANSERPFLWAVRPGMVRGSEWIESLPIEFHESVGERGRIVKWAPQKEVLAHAAVGGFWSHCGWNSTVESICEGVPMICKPLSGDQHVNTSYICNVWKTGLELRELERGDIERTNKRLMVDVEGNEIRERAMDLKEKADVCVMEGGSTSCCIDKLTKQILSV